MSVNLKQSFLNRAMEVAVKLTASEEKELQEVAAMLQGTDYSPKDSLLFAQVTRGVSQEIRDIVEQALAAMNRLGPKSFLEAFREENPEKWALLSPAQKTGDERLPFTKLNSGAPQYPTPADVCPL